MIDAAFLEFTDTCSVVLPLFPAEGSQTTHDPVVERTNKAPCFSMAVVSPPATGEVVQLLDDLPETSATTAAGYLVYPFPEPSKALGMDTNARVASGAGKAEP